MAYQMYTTRALVCGSYHRNAADVSYRLFTEQFGMLYAAARSVREERSRQRYGLQDFGFVQVSLVRGKAEWKIGSVVPLDNPFLRVADRAGRRTINSIIRLHNRYVQGEVENEAIFSVMYEALLAIAENRVQWLTYYELGITFKILYLLGYVAPEGEQLELLQSPISAMDYKWNEKLYKSVQGAVAKASDVSQL